MIFEVLTPPATDPVTLAEAKEHLRIVDYAGHDEKISRCISSATEWCENYTERALLNQTRKVVFDFFSSPMHLPGGRVVPASLVVCYIDHLGSEQVLASGFRLVGTGDNETYRVVLSPGSSWPLTDGSPQCVSIKYTCGYGPDASYVPRIIKQSILIHSAFQFENPDLPMSEDVYDSMQRMLSPYRLSRIFSERQER